MFIVFEGIDGSGKTTQAQMLCNFLEQKKQRKCIITDEPTESIIGILIKGMLRSSTYAGADYTQLLFSADRAYHLSNFIKPKMAKGYDIILDRYMMSTIAYGAASGLDREWLIGVNQNFDIPDATFLMDLKPQTAMERINKRKGIEYFENLKFLTKARKEYLSLAKRYKNCFVLDSTKKQSEVNTQIIKIMEKIM